MTPTELQSRLHALLLEERAEFAKQDRLGTGRGWAKTEWIREERLKLMKGSR
jgi:hypothetical protein